MCRQHELWGWMLVAFGIGVLFGIFLESGFLRCCVSIGCICVGFSVMRKK